MLHDTMMTSVDMEQLQPISRTYQYRKVMKPMLERKRRARINRCLDELKELMVSALQAEGENVSKLEKADILELTVRHLHKLRRQQRLSANPVTDADRFRAGFTHCATEVSRCLAATPGVDVQLGTKLMTHLGHRLNDMDKTLPLSIQVGPVPHHHPQGYNTPPGSPAPLSVSSDDSTSSGASCCGDDPVTTVPGSGSYYGMPLTPSSTASSGSARNLSTGVGLLKVAEVSPARKSTEPVWRPW